MADKDTSMRIERSPSLVANLNTYVLVAGFILTLGGGVYAWGGVVTKFSAAIEAHSIDIERLDKRLTTVETENRQIANHELRISRVEAQARDAANAMRTVETSLNALTTDVKVVREILTRIEAGQAQPPRRTRFPP